jgi:hypothetical protein
MELMIHTREPRIRYQYQPGAVLDSEAKRQQRESSVSAAAAASGSSASAAAAAAIAVPNLASVIKRARTPVRSITAFQLSLAQGAHATSLHVLLTDYEENTHTEWTSLSPEQQAVFQKAVQPLYNAKNRTYLINAAQLLRVYRIEEDEERLSEALTAWKALEKIERDSFKDRIRRANLELAIAPPPHSNAAPKRK